MTMTVLVLMSMTVLMLVLMPMLVLPLARIGRPSDSTRPRLPTTFLTQL